MKGAGLRADFHPGEAAIYLARHGKGARVLQQRDGIARCRRILRLPRDMGTVYIVMGAYGRGRVTKALLGGVTDTLLRQSETPPLLAHYGSSVRQ